jgi:hypothetical protein
MIVDTVISYCTVDDMFIRENIRQCLFFSKDIYIIVSSHFFDGTPEDETKIGALKEYCKQFTNVHLIRFRWDNTKSTSYWHSYMRWVGVQQCNTEYIMFMDSDEIFEGEVASKAFEDDAFFSVHDEYVFSCYWYFREPVFRAKTIEQAHKLVRASIITKKDFLSENEFGWIGFSGKYKCLHNVQYGGRPILHHFSWVRTKEEMLRKTSSWAHKDYKNWKELIEEEFSRPFNGTDFVHGYEYDIISAPFEFPRE